MKKNKIGDTVKTGTKALGSLRHGRWLSAKFFTRHWGLVLAVVALAMIYITNRYQCTVAMERIQHLERQLNIVKSERIRTKSRYMSAIRESAMQHRIDSLHLNLQVTDRPPYRLKVDD